MWTKKENIPAHNHGQETKHHLKISLFCLRCSFFFLIKIFYSTFNLEGISIWKEWWRWDKFLQQKSCLKQTLTSEFGGNMPKLSRGQSICLSDHGIHKLDPVNILLLWSIFQVALLIGLDWFVNDVVHFSPSSSIVGNCWVDKWLCS